MASDNHSNSSKDDERRNMKRVDTLRDVLYSRLNATGPLHGGMAVDMSAGGMRIQTRYPVDVGTELNIELKPRDDDDLEEMVILRGRVVHVVPMDDGEYAMGVKLILKSGARTSIDYAYIARVMGAQRTSNTSSSRGSTRSGGGGKPVPVTYRKVRSRSRRGGGIVALVIAAALGMWWLLPEQAAYLGTSQGSADGYLALDSGDVPSSEIAVESDDYDRSEAAPASAAGEQRSVSSLNSGLASSRSYDTPSLPHSTEPFTNGLAGGSGNADSEFAEAGPLIARDHTLSPSPIPGTGDVRGDEPATLSRSEGLDLVDDPEADLRITPVHNANAIASALPAAVGESLTPVSSQTAPPPNGPLGEFAKLLRDADTAAALHNRTGALRKLDAAFRVSGSVPTAWLSAARQLEQNLLLPGNAPASLGPMNDALELSASEPVFGDQLQVEVDRINHVLTVRRGARVLRSFPVGLGSDGATPVGEFVIANKISDPHWYNRGDVVKAGDPANPLGESWMGLGTDGTATSYGIHPTREVDSIGASKSRGCIRMWPEDAATLFRLCPIGTPVMIRG